MKSKQEMSHSDINQNWIKKWEKKYETLSLEDDPHIFAFAKEVRKIRQKTLRKLIQCYFLTFDCFKYGVSATPYTLDLIQKALNCGRREAYDYWRTMNLISKLNGLIESEIYTAMGKIAIAESKKIK